MDMFKNNVLAQWIGSFMNFLATYKLIVGVVLICSTASVVGVIGYRWYDEQVQRSASEALHKAMKIYHRPVSKEKEADAFATQQERWAAIEQVFKDSYVQHSGSGIAPLFLLYQGEALLNQDKQEKALELFTQALSKMPEGALKDAWSVKKALIQIDTENDQIKQEGLNTLNQIAYDKQSGAQEYAQYHIGLHHWHNDQFDQAKAVWHQMMVQHAQRDDAGGDLFVSKVKSKLALITPEN